MSHPREPLESHMIAGLSEAMREKLAQRRHHGNWREQTRHALIAWLRAEVRELADALDEWATASDCDDIDAATANVRAECADVACLAGMILDAIERAPLRAGDTEAARWAERNRVLEARLQAVWEAVK